MVTSFIYILVTLMHVQLYMINTLSYITSVFSEWLEFIMLNTIVFITLHMKDQ